MKVVQVNIDYSYEVNSSNEEWLNHEDRHCDILVRDDEAETVKYPTIWFVQTIRRLRVSGIRSRGSRHGREVCTSQSLPRLKPCTH